MGISSPLKDAIDALQTHYQEHIIGNKQHDEEYQKRRLVIDIWITDLRALFYDKAWSNGANKFMSIETMFVEIFLVLSDELLHNDFFWSFIIDFIIHLQSHGESKALIDEEEQEEEEEEIKVKKNKPNAPLGFLLVGAIRKLLTSKPNQLTICHVQGQFHTRLVGFCHQGLQEPETIDQKLLIEVLDLFQVIHFNQQLLQKHSEYLLVCKNHATLVKFVALFHSKVEWKYEKILREMTASRDWPTAELFVRTMSTSTVGLEKTLVQLAIEYQEFKKAHKLVHRFQLQNVFPEIEKLYNRDTLVKLCEKERWSIACTFVGNDRNLQLILLEYLVLAQEISLAKQYANKFQIKDFEPSAANTPKPRPRPTASKTETGSTSKTLEFSLDLKRNVFFCNKEEQLDQARQHFLVVERKTLFPYTIVGIDVEWRPTTSKNEIPVASILQLSSSSSVIIVDLIMLEESQVLFDFLQDLLTSKTVLKVGFAFEVDLRVLRQTFEDKLTFFQQVNSFLELQKVVVQIYGSNFRKSLSNATTRLLGKPLDKSMQVSNWEERPLSSRQLKYAALDALCLVQMTQQLLTTHEELITSSIVHLTEPSPQSESPDTDCIRRRQARKKIMLSQKEILPQLSSQDVLVCYQNALQVLKQNANDFQLIPHTDMDSFRLKVLELKQLSATEIVVINSLCFFCEDEPCIACLPSKKRLDAALLASLCGVSRRKIRLAKRTECTQLFGFVPGSVPPFGHRTKCKVFVDSSLSSHVKYLLAGGGSKEIALWISMRVFEQMTQPIYGEICIKRHNAPTDPPASETTSTNATSNTETTVEYKFLADAMVTRMARWLRTLGVDILIWDPITGTTDSAGTGPGPTQEGPTTMEVTGMDEKTLLLTVASKEQRILITRDKKIAQRRDAGACFVVSCDDPQVQFHEVRQHFGLELKHEDMMSRCAKCNSKGFQDITKEQVRQSGQAVLERVLQTVDHFYQCKNRLCLQIFWEGPQYDVAYEKMIQRFQDGGKLTSDTNC